MSIRRYGSRVWATLLIAAGVAAWPSLLFGQAAGGGTAHNDGSGNGTREEPEANDGEMVLRIEIDMVRYITLPGDAETVYVANPDIVDITPFNKNRIFVLAKQPGQTNIIVLTTTGDVMMNVPVVVIPQHSRTVTFNRGTEEQLEQVCGPRCIELGKRKDRSGNRPAAAPPPQAPDAASATAAEATAAAAAAAAQPPNKTTTGNTAGNQPNISGPLIPPSQY